MGKLEISDNSTFLLHTFKHSFWDFKTSGIWRNRTQLTGLRKVHKWHIEIMI